jgi:hypothetical protein
VVAVSMRCRISGHAGPPPPSTDQPTATPSPADGRTMLRRAALQVAEDAASGVRQDRQSRRCAPWARQERVAPRCESIHPKDSADHDEIAGVLHGLVTRMSDRLTEKDRILITEVGELRLALEQIADVLSEIQAAADHG